MNGEALLAPLVRGTSALVFSDLGVFGGALGAFVGGALRVRRAHVEAAMARAGVERPQRAGVERPEWTGVGRTRRAGVGL